ncbi:fluoride efflux transporter FluC [Periweissella beninensis]|uniref:fluoride efflux transporter FluC n=1 Tax=Periweissella beninensis TaxID=504936 RepID=UPI0021A7AB46|nr:CrcB family protein [Periweissella beninensis]MCT4396173.1 CrcB family protein [Periweissella beninensis]
MFKAQNIISIGVFAFFGGTLRYLLGEWLSYNGTILVNLSGSFLLALLTYYAIVNNRWPEWLTVGLGTGFVGSYTTFSTFNIDMLKMITQNQAGLLSYFLTTVIGGLGCAFLGYLVAKQFNKRGQR